MIRIAEFREFYEIYRGEKEYFLALKMVERYNDIAYYVFAPSIPSPLDRQFGFTNEHFLQIINKINRYSPRYKVVLYDAFLLKITNDVYLSIPSNPLAFFKKIVSFKPDILIDIPLTTLSPRSYLVYLASKRLNAPLILFYSGDLPQKYLTFRRLLRPFEEIAFREVSLVISYNYAYLLYLAVNHPNITFNEKAFVLPKLINYERFRQDQLSRIVLSSLERKLGLKGKFVVGYVGRFEKRKNIETLIDLARVIRCDENYRNKIVLLLIGEGGLRQHLETLKQKEDLPIIICGPLSHEMIPYMYALMDVCIFPTTPFFSTALLEAMASGKIIISVEKKRDYGKYSTPLINNHNSVVIQDHDTVNLSRKIFEVIKEIMRNKKFYETLGRNAKNDVINHFNIEKLCARYRKLLEIVLKRYQ